MVLVHPAASPGSESLGNQKALLKAGQEMNLSWQHTGGEQGGSHTCLLTVLAWWVCEGPAS